MEKPKYSIRKPNLYNIFSQIQYYKNNRWNAPTQGGKLHHRKSKKVIFFATNPKEESQSNIIPPLTTN